MGKLQCAIRLLLKSGFGIISANPKFILANERNENN